MSDYPIDPTLQDYALAYQLYQALLAQGVMAKEMDQGYRVTNYAGIHCPNKTDSFCMQGTPGVLEANDILEYAFNHDQKYQALLVKALGEPLPWSLDDLDPATVFDEQIRARVQEAIDVLRGILKTNGIAEGTEDYKERMAVGMFYLAALPDAETIKVLNQNLFTPMSVQKIVGMQELENLGLGSYRDYLTSHGGFHVEGNYSEEYTALDAIRNNQGECTEQSKILFAMLRIAGLDPEFVLIDHETLQLQYEKDNVPEDMEHVCVGIYILGRFQLLDPAHFDSNAYFKKYDRLTLRQYLCGDFSIRGNAWVEKGNLDKADFYCMKAMEIDPKNEEALLCRGNIWDVRGNLERAIADCTEALGINPESAKAYSLRGYVWARKGDLDKATADYTRALGINPKGGLTYYNRAVVLVLQDKLKEAIQDLASCLNISPELSEQAHGMLISILGNVWQSDQTRIQTATRFESDTGGLKIVGAQALFILSYALWEAGMIDQSKEKFGALSSAIGSCTCTNLSPTSKTFFNDMFKLMPPTMQQDKEVSEMLRVMKEKIKF